MDRWKVREAIGGPSLPRCGPAGYLVPPAQGQGPVSRTALSSDQRWIVGLVSKPTQLRTVRASGPGFGIRQAGGQIPGSPRPARCLYANGVISSNPSFLMCKMGLSPLFLRVVKQVPTGVPGR